MNRPSTTLEWEIDENWDEGCIRDIIRGIPGAQLVEPIEVVGSKRRITLSAPDLETLEQAIKYLCDIIRPSPPRPPPPPPAPLRRVVDLSRALPFFCDCPDVFAANITRKYNVEATWQDEDRGLLKISSVEQILFDEAISYLNLLSENAEANIETILPKLTVSVDVTDLKLLAEESSSGDIMKFLRFKLGCAITKSKVSGRVLYSCTSCNPYVREVFQGCLESIVADPTNFLMDFVGRQMKRVHIFVDVSNIMSGSQNVANGRDTSIRVIVQPLVELVRSFRTLHRGVAVGSHPATHPMWNHWKEQRFDVHTFQTVPNGQGGANEQAVDDVIHALALAEVNMRFDPPHSLCLLTGDGNRNNGRTTFADVVEAALRNDWEVVMWSWERSTARIYKTFQQTYPSQFSIYFLDQYRDMITFHEKPKTKTVTQSSKPISTHVSMADVVSVFQRFIQTNFPQVGFMHESDLPRLLAHNPTVREFVATYGSYQICTSPEARGVLIWNSRARTISLAASSGGQFEALPMTSQLPPPPQHLHQPKGQISSGARRSGSASHSRQPQNFEGRVAVDALKPAGGNPSRGTGFQKRCDSVGRLRRNDARIRSHLDESFDYPSGLASKR